MNISNLYTDGGLCLTIVSPDNIEVVHHFSDKGEKKLFDYVSVLEHERDDVIDLDWKIPHRPTTVYRAVCRATSSCGHLLRFHDSMSQTW